MNHLHTDVLVVGGGTGGVAAALAAARMGRSVVLTEQTDWLGGQLTAQAVPPDENWWIEDYGATNAYRQYREGVRRYYRRHYPLSEQADRTVQLNPGGGFVSRLCHEPRAGLAVIEALLAPYRSSGRLTVLLHCRPTAASTTGDRIESVTFANDDDGSTAVVSASYVLDATELGDVLALAAVEHVVGAESQQQTGELHAVTGEPQPLDQQAISWCFALDWRQGEDHTIERPVDYDTWVKYQPEFWPGPLFSWQDVYPHTLQPRQRALFEPNGHDLWHYRRILRRANFRDGAFDSDITMVNWPQIDYWLGPVVGVPDAQVTANYEACRQLSLSFLYWMQTEAPRPDGDAGFPELRLRPDVVGTTDGLAKHAYIRESRRIRAEFTVREQHVGVQQRKGLLGSELFNDSVGIGSYRIDLHPSTGLRSYVDISCYPFQIPLGALLPERVDNLLAAGKNLGVTHITNGCYRLHPVEWNVGEVSGTLAAHCLAHHLTPRQVRNTPVHLADFQATLRRAGVPLEWPSFLREIPV